MFSSPVGQAYFGWPILWKLRGDADQKLSQIQCQCAFLLMRKPPKTIPVLVGGVAVVVVSILHPGVSRTGVMPPCPASVFILACTSATTSAHDTTCVEEREMMEKREGRRSRDKTTAMMLLLKRERERERETLTHTYIHLVFGAAWSKRRAKITCTQA
jgi:hypothetical protein